ncbi:MAG: signal peptide peptidase SppA [Cyanobacteria bacterium CRU_2_1]|nr:signal peptide peptidase SppA [Cyanobacteria bacterium RU_5_0]NJR61378.1 signal peptide peptidase SppA [Cyanobacteria bacterium CRU_2_1]
MRDFLKYTFATVLGLVLFVSLGAVGLLAFVIAIASSASQNAAPRVEQDSILTFDLSQEITDSNPAADPSDVISTALSGGEMGKPIALRSVLESLEQAVEDDRIVGLYLHGTITPTQTGSGFATLREVRQALQKFRDSGKPIYAYNNAEWKERDYYLTSVANTILLHPSSLLELNGLNFENIFFAGALQKYGIGIQVLRVGKYKSAVEPFIRTESSPEDEEQTRRLLSDLWNEFLTSTSQSRNLTPQQLQAIADQQALLLPEQAQQANLIDKVAYEDELETELRNLASEDEETGSFQQISLPEYAEVIDQDDRPSPNRIVVIYAEGDIVSGGGGIGMIGGDSLVSILRELRQDEAVKAIVLRVNSPGGSATASEQISREVFLTVKEKPVIVSMGSYAASGGYQISAYANRIFASPNTVTGSIGVFGLLPNFQAIARNNGITWDTVKTGRYADIDTVSRPRTPEELAIGQQIVDRIYDQFLSIVSESRQLPKETVAEIAQGRVWSGVEAQKIGLVDDLGGLEDAIQAAVEAAELGDDWQLEEYPESQSFWLADWFNSRVTQSPVPADPVSLELQKLQDDLETLKSMNDPLGVYNRLPFNPKID